MPVVLPAGAVPTHLTDDVVVRVPLVWPEAALGHGSRPGSGADDISNRVATFQLAGPDRADQLVLDWVVHVWLFVAAYELAESSVLFGSAGTLTVPVRRAVSRSG